MVAVKTTGPLQEYSAIIAAIAAALNASVRPGDKATIYDGAVQDLAAARISFLQDKDEMALVSAVKKVILRMKVRYSGRAERASAS
jgi:hypothetical protein